MIHGIYILFFPFAFVSSHGSGVFFRTDLTSLSEDSRLKIATSFSLRWLSSFLFNALSINAECSHRLEFAWELTRKEEAEVK